MNKRGVEGETIIHLLLNREEPMCSEIAKILIIRYPGLANDIFLGKEMFGWFFFVEKSLSFLSFLTEFLWQNYQIHIDFCTNLPNYISYNYFFTFFTHNSQ